MNKSNYPVWLKIALRMPRSWRHWLRDKLARAEYWSTVLVTGGEAGLCELIENTSSPDFDAFDKRLTELKEAWGKHDSHLEGYAVRARLMRFKADRGMSSG